MVTICGGNAMLSFPIFPSDLSIMIKDCGGKSIGITVPAIVSQSMVCFGFMLTEQKAKQISLSGQVKIYKIVTNFN